MEHERIAASGARLGERARRLPAAATTAGAGPPIRDQADLAVTCRAFWALSEAKRLGLAVNADTLKRAQGFLQNAFRGLKAADNDGKALIVHALSTAGAAEFAHLNRLYRERNTLGETALAHTALAFASIGRKTFAGELLDLLLTKADRTTSGRRATSSPGRGPEGRRLLLLPTGPRRVDGAGAAAPARGQARRAGGPGRGGLPPESARHLRIHAAEGTRRRRGGAREVLRQRQVRRHRRPDRGPGERPGRAHDREPGRPRRSSTFRVPAELLPDGKVLVEFRKRGAGGVRLRGHAAGLLRGPREDPADAGAGPFDPAALLPREPALPRSATSA